MQARFGFHPAFAVAAFGMVISVSILWRFKRYIEGDRDRRRSRSVGVHGRAAAGQHSAIDAVADWKRIGALIVIFPIVIVFWMVFHQNGSTHHLLGQREHRLERPRHHLERDQSVLGHHR